jgi:isopenicillin N synthase-like dioxygenase
MSSELPLARFQVVDIEKLGEADHAEKKKLYLAAKHDGFFYLSFGSMSDLDQFEEVLDGIYALQHHLFNLPEEEKMKFDVDKQGPLKLNGYAFTVSSNLRVLIETSYKPMGRNIGGVGRKQDGFESWAVSTLCEKWSETAYLRHTLDPKGWYPQDWRVSILQASRDRLT